MKSGSLTPSSFHFLCLTPEGSKNSFLLCPAKMIDARLNFICSKYTTLRHSTATKVSDLNSYFCGNAVPITVSLNRVAIIVIIIT